MRTHALCSSGSSAAINSSRLSIMSSRTEVTNALPSAVGCTKTFRRSSRACARRARPSFSRRSTSPVAAAVVWPMRCATSRDLTDSELESFANLLTMREAREGERILEEGTIVNHLYIVCDGVVHVRRLAQTKEMLLGRFGVGAFFGEINLFDPGTATAS